MKQLSVKSSPVSGAGGLCVPTIILHLGRCGFPVAHREEMCVCISRGCVCISRGTAELTMAWLGSEIVRRVNFP